MRKEVIIRYDVLRALNVVEESERAVVLDTERGICLPFVSSSTVLSPDERGFRTETVTHLVPVTDKLLAQLSKPVADAIRRRLPELERQLAQLREEAARAAEEEARRQAEAEQAMEEWASERERKLARLREEIAQKLGIELSEYAERMGMAEETCAEFLLKVAEKFGTEKARAFPSLHWSEQVRIEREVW